MKSSWHSPSGFGTPISNVVPLGLPRYNANIVVVFLLLCTEKGGNRVVQGLGKSVLNHETAAQDHVIVHVINQRKERGLRHLRGRHRRRKSRVNKNLKLLRRTKRKMKRVERNRKKGQRRESPRTKKRLEIKNQKRKEIEKGGKRRNDSGRKKGRKKEKNEKKNVNGKGKNGSVR